MDDCLHGAEPETCELCAQARQPCWVTRSGTAYHLNSNCPALHDLRKNPVIRKTVGFAKGTYQPCHVCVNHVCIPCARGRHRHCDPRPSLLDACSCATAGHPPA